jgi:hypothetical protein
MTKPTLLIAACAAAAALVAPTASAVVPPKDCGTTTVSGKRYQIKADQIRCTTAKTYSRTYLKTGRKPSGWTCKKYSASTKLKFRCDRRSQVFFAIKR